MAHDVEHGPGDTNELFGRTGGYSEHKVLVRRRDILDFDDIQHILLTRAPALTGRYDFLSFRNPAGGRAWLAAILEKVQSARGARTRSSG